MSRSVSSAPARRCEWQKNQTSIWLKSRQPPPRRSVVSWTTASSSIRNARLKQKIIQVKEVKFRPGTDEGDYLVKMRNVKRFLEDGDKAKITLRFRGREMAHQEFGVRLLDRIRTELDDMAMVEQMPKLEGRQMIMVIAPKRKK